MDVSFIKTSPNENMTILIRGDFAPALYDKIGGAIVAYNSVHADQVAFFEKPEDPRAWLRLNTVGGFCGNAIMSGAAVTARERGFKPGEKVDVPLETPAAPGLLFCSVAVEADGYRTRLKMPLPVGVEQRVVPFGEGEVSVGLVHFPGITHIICELEPGASFDMRAFAAHAVRNMAELSKADTMGVMFLKGGEMTPFVYTKPIDLRVWERGCGSGTSAVGAWFAGKRKESVELALSQPGGVMEVSAGYEDGAVSEIYVTCHIWIAAEGVAHLRTCVQ